MTTQAPAASARPDIISLDVLLNDVDEGRIQIPRFQRPYVWTPQMMRELFESVLRGYPIGSLLFWAPRDFDVLTMDKIGPIRAPSKHPSFPAALVLDGHQRLATLYGVLRLPEEHPKDESASAEELSWWIGYDLRLQEPKQMRPEDFENPAVLPLRSVLKTVDFVRFARSIDADSRIEESEKGALLDRADKVQRAIRDYRIALTNMRDGNVDDAVAIFSRINRSGRRMTTDQMAVALTYQDGFNLEDTLDEMLGSLDRFGFGDVSRTVVLQSLLHGASKNFTKPNFDDLRSSDTRTALQLATPRVTEALCRAAEFLNEEIGFRTGRLLPYALQLLLLGVFFHVKRHSPSKLAERTKYALSRWFWATSFEGWFASANTAEVDRAVRAMEEFARAPENDTASHAAFGTFFVDRALRPFPKTFDRRSARIRAMLLVQIARGDLLDPITGQCVDGSALMADPDRRDLPYVFPPSGTRSARSPANRILLPRSHGNAVRSSLAQHLDSQKALESHGVNAAAQEAIANRDLDGFVRAREAELQRQEQEFLKKFDLSIGETVARSEEEFDIDE